MTHNLNLVQPELVQVNNKYIVIAESEHKHVYPNSAIKRQKQAQ